MVSIVKYTPTGENTNFLSVSLRSSSQNARTNACLTPPCGRASAADTACFVWMLLRVTCAPGTRAPLRTSSGVIGPSAHPRTALFLAPTYGALAKRSRRDILLSGWSRLIPRSKMSRRLLFARRLGASRDLFKSRALSYSRGPRHPMSVCEDHRTPYKDEDPV